MTIPDYNLTDGELKDAKVGYAAILVNGRPEIRESDRVVADTASKKAY